MKAMCDQLYQNQTMSITYHVYTWSVRYIHYIFVEFINQPGLEIIDFYIQASSQLNSLKIYFLILILCSFIENAVSQYIYYTENTYLYPAKNLYCMMHR